MLADFMASIKKSARQNDGRPNITLSYAQSLDGSIAMNRGSHFTLSSLESQTLTHILRASHEAILVGIETVIADNPFLTVRLVEGQNPLPIVLDSHLRLPLDSNLLKNQVSPLIATTESASQANQERIEKMGAKIVRVLPDERGWVDLDSLLAKLADLGINNIMVEGGARVISSFLSRRLVDWIIITVVPKFMGGLHALENPLNFYNPELNHGNGSPEFKNFECEQVGKDIIIWSKLSWVLS